MSPLVFGSKILLRSKKKILQLTNRENGFFEQSSWKYDTIVRGRRPKTIQEKQADKWQVRSSSKTTHHS
jgi:hypothetical protein